MPHNHHSSSFPSCFRPSATTNTVVSAYPDLTTSLYQTQQGLFALTWCKNLFGTRSLYIHLLLLDSHHLSFPPSPSFHLQINPRFTFWKKRGSKTLVGLPNTTSTTTAQVFWDLSLAKFGSRPDPLSGYYVAIFIEGEMTLLVGEEELLLVGQLPRSMITCGGGGGGGGAACARPTPKETAAAEVRNREMVLRREHVYGNNKKKLYYTTRANIGAGQQEIDVSIEYRVVGGTDDDSTLSFSIENKRVLQVKHLKWKFRGNVRIEVDGIPPVQVSWDVYNWLFVQDDDEHTNAYALFMFKFEKKLVGGGGGGLIMEEDNKEKDAYRHRRRRHHDYYYHDLFTNSGSLKNDVEKNKLQQKCGGLNLIGFETKKKMMEEGFQLRSGRSSSSSSVSSSSASSSNSTSSVLEWASVEENELKGGPCGFSLVVYAWNFN